MVYAVVKAGGRQEKVEVGSVVTLNWTQVDDDGRVLLPAVLLVDGKKMVTDPKKLVSVKVTAELVEDLRGPKIRIQKFRNKTGYRKRQGHRQELSRLKIVSIDK